MLEIGTEELPADFARMALPQLEHVVRRDLQAQRLSHGLIQTTGTPRRLAITVHALPSGAADRQEDRKGPPAAQGLINGQPTPAGLGFAKRCGVSAEALEIRDTPKGPFVFASVVERGRPTLELLAEHIPTWIEALQGRRFMRWAAGDARFSRPVRWLVALLDDDVIPVTLSHGDPLIQASNSSRGHRLVAQSVTIANASVYAETLAGVGVQVDRCARQAQINSAVAQAAERFQARPDLPSSLLEELTDLVEYPTLIVGSIDAGALALPAEVLCTVMRSHQRYVPLYRLDARVDPLALECGDVLLPRFLCIANGLLEATDAVRRGNERVLKARLADARFFVQADRSVPSIDRRDQLARVTFAEGLGSLRDRVERLEWCTDVLLHALALPQTTAVHAQRAAHLCKHDLVSQMVGEFPELQGLMGAKYLVAEGEPSEVALAVLEHYLPRGAGDALPQSDAGAVLALAERLELLLSIYAKGERPTGSSDPYALRRAGNGLLQILWSKDWRLDLGALLQRMTSHWATLLPKLQVDAVALSAELVEFLRQRLVSLLEEDGLASDLVQAVAGSTIAAERVVRDPADARLRAELLGALRNSGELAAVEAVVTRAARLAEKGDLSRSVLSAQEVVNPALFEKTSEAAMLAVVEQLEPIAASGASERYRELAELLAASAPTLAAFFDGEQSVMVMSDDPVARTNRLNLLAVLRNQATVLADFSRLSL